MGGLRLWPLWPNLIKPKGVIMEQLEEVMESVLNAHVDQGEAKKALSDGAFAAGTYDVVVKRVNVRPLNDESFTPNRVIIGMNLSVKVDDKTHFIWEDISPNPYFTYRDGESFKTITKDDPEWNAALKHDRKYKLFAALVKIVNPGREPLTNKDVLERLDGKELKAKVAEMFTVADGSKAFAWDNDTRETYLSEGLESKNLIIDFFA